MSNMCFRSKNLKYLVFGVSLFTLHESLYSFRNSSESKYYNSNYNHGTYSSGQNNWQSSKKDQSGETEDFDNFPFIKAQSTIEKDKVAGIRIKKDKIILLGYEKTFSVDTLKQDEDFSDLSFFRQYPKLFSVEINSTNLSNQALENLQKFLPNQGLKNLIIDSCVLEKGGAELIADIITKHNSLKAISIKLIKLTPEDAEKITEATSQTSDLDYFSIGFGEIKKSSCHNIVETIEKSKKLKSLFLFWDKIIDKEADKKSDDNEESYTKLAEAISDLRQLNSLDISILSASENCIESAIKPMAKLTALTKLKLYFGNLSLQNHVKLFKTAEVLGETINNLKQLQTLNISYILLPKDAMQVLAQSIANLKKLEYLNLSGNIIDKETATILAESFKELDCLKTLIIRDCKIDSQSFSDLCKNISSLPINTLCAGNNQIKDGIKSLPIKTMTALRFVDFANNDITLDMIMGVLPDTIDHESLQALDFKNNKTLYETDANGNIDSKRDIIEDWKLKNKSKLAIFGL